MNYYEPISSYLNNKKLKEYKNPIQEKCTHASGYAVRTVAIGNNICSYCTICDKIIYKGENKND